MGTVTEIKRNQGVQKSDKIKAAANASETDFQKLHTSYYQMCHALCLVLQKHAPCGNT